MSIYVLLSYRDTFRVWDCILSLAGVIDSESFARYADRDAVVSCAGSASRD